jgi:hypothetical protein
LVFAHDSVAVHCVEVELGGVDDEVVVEVLGIGQGFEDPTAGVEGDLNLSPIPDACTRLRALGEELDGDAARVPRPSLPTQPGWRLASSLVLAHTRCASRVPSR